MDIEDLCQRIESRLVSIRQNPDAMLGFVSGIPASRFFVASHSRPVDQNYGDGFVMELWATLQDEETITARTRPVDFFREGERVVFVWQTNPVSSEIRDKLAAVDATAPPLRS